MHRRKLKLLRLILTMTSLFDMSYPDFKLFCENRPDEGWFEAQGTVQILDVCEDMQGRDTVEFECPLCKTKHWSNVITEYRTRYPSNARTVLREAFNYEEPE